MGGTYTIRIHNFRFDAGTNTYLGVAWNKNTANTLNALSGNIGMALNTTKPNQATNRGASYWDTYSGPASACAAFLSDETGLERVFRIQTPSTGTIAASLSSIVTFRGVNSDIDVIILRASGAANLQNSQTIACGDTSASIASQPAGTYYVVIDGFSGSVAKFNLTVNFTAGVTAAGAAAESLPQR